MVGVEGVEEVHDWRPAELGQGASGAWRRAAVWGSRVRLITPMPTAYMMPWINRRCGAVASVIIVDLSGR